MRIPAAWLREFVSVPEDEAGLLTFCDKLTMAGLEVEEILSTQDGPTLYTKITPNRGDWASVYGTAREAAAAMRLSLAPLAPPAPNNGGAMGYGTSNMGASTTPVAPPLLGAGGTVTIEDADACPRYSATIIRGVKIGPTPAWLQTRLYAALGDKYKPINNVVDATNYVMLELGQPLHAFDFDTLPEGKIVVRKAKAGEKLTTLDGIERELSPEMLCICDYEKPVAIAGIMGGGPTEITEGTTNILLESAHFDALSIRRTAKRLPLATEASYRFERYVDPALVPIAAERCAKLIVQLAGGTIDPVVVDVVAKKTPPRRLLARMERIRQLLGADVDREEAIAALERLGISVERSANALDCQIPSWRPDLTIEDDIAEEVGRIALGYENLPETAPPLLNPKGGDSPRGRFLTAVKEALVRAGLQEVQSHSLIAPSPLTTEEEIAKRVRVRSALSPELSSLRTSLLPNLLAITSRAHAAGTRDIAIFEAGPVYWKAESGDGYTEPLRVTGVVSGSAMPQAWALKQENYPADFYFAKGIVEELLSVLGIASATFAAGTHPITHPGRTATVSVDGKTLGIVAELSEPTIEAEDLPRRTYIFDLDGEVLREFASDTRIRYTPLPKYPAVVRDLAPVFALSIPYSTIETAARDAAGPLLESLRLTDIYTGANLGEGNRSLTLRFTFRSATGTLKDTEVEASLANVRQALTALGGDFRGA